MGNLDRTNQGVPQGGYKRDWTLYQGAGSGGGSGGTVTGTTRYTFWIDHSKFSVFVRKLITQNVSFNIYSDAGLTLPQSVYIGVSQSDDAPDAVIRAQGLQIVPGTTPTPYFINTTFLTQPLDFNYQNDQGRYVYNAYAGNGLGTGNNGKIVQSFVPQSPGLTGVWLRDLFHVGSLTDPLLYNDLIVELWATDKTVLARQVISKYALQVDPTDSNVESYVTATDGLQYWYEFSQRRVRFTQLQYKVQSGDTLSIIAAAYGMGTPTLIGYNPQIADPNVISVGQMINLNPPGGVVKTIPGQAHYICVKQDVSSAAHHYGIGSNTGSGGSWDGNASTYYINGAAYTAPYASTVLTAVGTNISICFATQRNNGRTAITFLWDSAAYYWYNPASFADQFRFVKEDTDRRI